MRILSFLCLVVFLLGASTEDGLILLAGGKEKEAYSSLKETFETTRDPKALFYMGYLNMHTFGNYGLGVNQIRQSANLGYPEAITQIGFLYHKAQNYTMALHWLQKAAKLKHPKAMYMIGYMYDKGQGVARNSAMARRWYSKARSGE